MEPRELKCLARCHTGLLPNWWHHPVEPGVGAESHQSSLPSWVFGGGRPATTPFVRKEAWSLRLLQTLPVLIYPSIAVLGANLLLSLGHSSVRTRVRQVIHAGWVQTLRSLISILGPLNVMPQPSPLLYLNSSPGWCTAFAGMEKRLLSFNNVFGKWVHTWLLQIWELWAQDTSWGKTGKGVNRVWIWRVLVEHHRTHRDSVLRKTWDKVGTYYWRINTDWTNSVKLSQGIVLGMWFDLTQ